jgi:hypothetical protein
MIASNVGTSEFQKEVLMTLNVAPVMAPEERERAALKECQAEYRDGLARGSGSCLRRSIMRRESRPRESEPDNEPGARRAQDHALRVTKYVRFSRPSA